MEKKVAFVPPIDLHQSMMLTKRSSPIGVTSRRVNPKLSRSDYGSRKKIEMCATTRGKQTFGERRDRSSIVEDIQAIKENVDLNLREFVELVEKMIREGANNSDEQTKRNFVTLREIAVEFLESKPEAIGVSDLAQATVKKLQEMKNQERQEEYLLIIRLLLIISPCSRYEVIHQKITASSNVTQEQQKKHLKLLHEIAKISSFVSEAEKELKHEEAKQLPVHAQVAASDADLLKSPYSRIRQRAGRERSASSPVPHLPGVMVMCRICEQFVDDRIFKDHLNMCSLKAKHEIRAIECDEFLKKYYKKLSHHRTSLLESPKVKKLSEKLNFIDQLIEYTEEALQFSANSIERIPVILSKLEKSFPEKKLLKFDRGKQRMSSPSIPSLKERFLNSSSSSPNNSNDQIDFNSMELYRELVTFLQVKQKLWRSIFFSSSLIRSSELYFNGSNNTAIGSSKISTSDGSPVSPRLSATTSPLNNATTPNVSSGSGSNLINNNNDNNSNNSNNNSNNNNGGSNSNNDKSVLTTSIPKITDFEIIKLITRGGFARVYLARKKATSDLYAIKVLKKRDMVEKNQVDRVFVEKNILAEVSCPFVVRLYYALQTKDNLCLAMEFLNGGDLFSLLSKKEFFPNEIAQFYIAEALLSLEYLHTHGIIHRDLKPDNFLINAKGHLKLTDFGLSHAGLSKQTQNFWESTKQNQTEEGNNNTEVQEKTIIGTPDYLAPEVLLGLPHSYSVDYWALGVILYEFLTGITPFTGESTDEVFENIMAGRNNMDWPEIPDEMSAEAQDLIYKLLDENPSTRLGSKGAEEVKSHPYFKGINWNNLTETCPPFIPPTSFMDDTSHFDARKQFWPLVEEDFGENSFVSLSQSSASAYEKFNDFWCINVQNLKDKSLEVLEVAKKSKPLNEIM